MRKNLTVMIMSVCLLLTHFSANSQQKTAAVTNIRPQHLAIAYTKTTNIIFPYAIKSVDRGSNQVLVQKATGVENILQLKARTKDFEETNLTVITADGELHSFILNYSSEPSVLNLSIGKMTHDQVTIQFLPDNRNEAELERYSTLAANAPQKSIKIKDKKFGIKLMLNGLFVRDDVMYFRINVENRSNITYDIDQLRFYIRDRKKSKRTATQEIEINPLHIGNVMASIEGQSEQSAVFAFPKFTIPDKKYLTVQMMEKNGGRHLELHIKNKTVVNSSVLPNTHKH